MNNHNRAIDQTKILRLVDINDRHTELESTLRVTFTVASILDEVLMDLREDGYQVTIDPYQYMSQKHIECIRIDFGGMCFADEKITEHKVGGVLFRFFEDFDAAVAGELERALEAEKYKDRPYVKLFYWEFAAAIPRDMAEKLLEVVKKAVEEAA